MLHALMGSGSPKMVVRMLLKQMFGPHYEAATVLGSWTSHYLRNWAKTYPDAALALVALVRSGVDFCEAWVMANRDTPPPE